MKRHEEEEATGKGNTVLVILGFALATALLVAATSVKTLHAKQTPAKPCEHWKEPRDPPPCGKEGIAEKLRVSLRDENCRTALIDPASAELVGNKLIKLSGGPFAFFRGTAAFFYNELFCSSKGTSFDWNDKSIPQVMSNGDSHPENFGVMELAGGKRLVWGVNDFDQRHV